VDLGKALAYFFPLPDGLAPASRVSSQAWNQNIVQEIRASGEVGPLHALLGVYYSRARAFGLINWPSVPAYEPTFDDDYRAIGFPNAQAGQETSYKPDTIWNYEGGMKTTWLDNRFVANIAGYYIKWANIQQIIILPCSDTFTGNFGSARSEGAEFDFHYSFPSGLKADVSGAWNQAWLTQTVAGAQGVAGQTLEYAPKWTGSVTLEYDRTLSADTSGYVRSSVNVTSHEYTSFATTSPWYVMPGYSLTNLRFGIKHHQWQSSLFFDNLFDKRAITDLYNAYGSNVPNTQPVGLNRPRTIGVDVRYDW
jgi:outer membrane receptor protein involved in Fe transport